MDCYRVYVNFLQDVVDLKFGLYVLQNSILTTFLKDSPMEIHQRIYMENVLTYGGFYSGAVLPPTNIIEKILTGNYLAFLADDGLPACQHLFTIVQEEVNSGPAGYYFQINLPIKDEIVDALMLFRDSGILQRVHRCYLCNILQYILTRTLVRAVDTYY